MKGTLSLMSQRDSIIRKPPILKMPERLWDGQQHTVSYLHEVKVADTYGPGRPVMAPSKRMAKVLVRQILCLPQNTSLVVERVSR